MRIGVRAVFVGLWVLAVLCVPDRGGAQVVGDPTFLLKFGNVAPPSPTSFNFETGIGVDSVTGDVWIPGTPIKRFDADGNFILSAGDCGQCMGIDVNLVNHDVYLAKPNAREILQYTQSGVFVRKWGSEGTGPGEFNSPNDLSIDSGRGEIYVIDGLRVQVFDLDGNWIREWGSRGTGPGQFTGFNGNYGVAFDPGTDTVVTSDSVADHIQVFDRFGNHLTGWDDAGGGTGPGQLRWARNVDFDPSGNIYTVDSDNERVQVFDPQGNYLRELRGLHDLTAGPFHPRGVAVNRSNGVKYVMAAYAQRVDKFDAADDYVLSFGDRPKGGLVLWAPKGVAVSQQTGDVYVMDSFNALVKRFSRTGQFVTQWGGSNRLDPLGDGRFGFDANELFGFDRSAIATDRYGNVWTAGGGIHYTGDPFLNSTRRFDPDGNFVSGFEPGLSPFAVWNERIWGIAIDPEDDRIYIPDAEGTRIRIHDPDGTWSPFEAISLPDKPAGVAIGGDSVYVVIPALDAIYQYTRAGAFVRQWGGEGSGPGQFDFDFRSGIAVDANGNLVVADTRNNRLQFFDADGNFLRTFGQAGAGNGRFASPVGVTVAQVTQTLYVADSGNHRIQAFALDGAAVCFDGIDNDSDGLVDLDDCNSVFDVTEGAGTRCNAGGSVALFAPALLMARARRRRPGRTRRSLPAPR